MKGNGMHNDRMKNKATSIPRRNFLGDTAFGTSAIALASLLQKESSAAERKSIRHYPVKAKRLIHIFSPGGVSQVDTFDHKPELARLDGKPLTGKGELDPFFGRPGNLRKSYYKFSRHGQCGRWRG